MTEEQRARLQELRERYRTQWLYEDEGEEMEYLEVLEIQANRKSDD